MTLDWKHKRSLKAAKTRKERYGTAIFKTMGATGGKHSRKLPQVQVDYEKLTSEPNDKGDRRDGRQEN